MANNKPKSLIKLPPETTQQLIAMEDTMARAKHDLETMKTLGIDTKELEEKLTWAEMARKTLLSEFS